MSETVHGTAWPQRAGRRILLIPQGTCVEHVARPLVIARELHARGCEVHFACSGPYARIIKNAGFDAYHISNVAPDLLLERTRKHRRSADAVELIGEYVDEEVTLIESLRPDVAVGDFRPTLSISCELTRTLYIAIANACWTRYSVTGAVRKPSLHRLFSMCGVGAVRELPINEMSGHLEPFNRFCRLRGLQSKSTIHDLIESTVLNLVMDVPQLFPMHGAPKHYRYVGPAMWEQQTKPPDWHERIREDVPTVYVSPAGAVREPPLLQTVFDALPDGNIQLIATTNGADPPPSLPPNCFVERFIPGSKIMKHCDLVICNASGAAIYQALAAGVPILAVNPASPEHVLNAHRIVELGAGLALLSRLKPKDLAEAVDTLLTTPAFRTTAGAMAGAIANYAAGRMGVEAIIQALDGRRAVHGNSAREASSTISMVTLPTV